MLIMPSFKKGLIIEQFQGNNLKLNITWLKIPAGRRRTSWLFIKRADDWTRDCREQIQLVVRAGLEPGAIEFQVQRSKRSASLKYK